MKFLTTSLLICLPFFGMAQMKQSTFVVGPKVGFNLTKVQITENPLEIQSNFRIDYNAGLYARLNLGAFSIQPEIMYQEKGGNFKKPTPQQQSYQYISMPFILGVKPLRGITIEAGPEYSWALNAGKVNSVRSIYGPDAKNDVAMVLGTRIDMLDAMSLLSVHLRYVHGFTDVSNRVSGTSPMNFQNRTIQLSVAYNLTDYYKWWKRHGNRKFKKD